MTLYRNNHTTHGALIQLWMTDKVLERIYILRSCPGALFLVSSKREISGVGKFTVLGPQIREDRP